MNNCISKNNVISEFENFYGEYIKTYNTDDVVFGSFWLALFGNYEEGKGALKYKNQIINFIVEDGKFIYDIEKLTKNLENINIEINNHWEDLGSHVCNIWYGEYVSVKTNIEVKEFLKEVINFFTINGKINLLGKLNISYDEKINFQNFYNSYLKLTGGYKKNKIMWFQGTFVFDWLKIIYYSNFLDGNSLPELEFIINKASNKVKSGLLGKKYIDNKNSNDLLYYNALTYKSDYIKEDKIFYIENILCEIGKKFYK